MHPSHRAHRIVGRDRPLNEPTQRPKMRDLFIFCQTKIWEDPSSELYDHYANACVTATLFRAKISLIEDGPENIKQGIAQFPDGSAAHLYFADVSIMEYGVPVGTGVNYAEMLSEVQAAARKADIRSKPGA